MKLQELKGKKILIAGFGREGRATERYLKARIPGINLTITDKKEGAGYLDKQHDYDLVIKTPGIRPELVKAPYTTASNIFFANIGQNFTIGITGSKGKSTTASLIAHILNTAGKKAHLVGNIGIPMLEALLKPHSASDIYVIELSSYQLADIKYSPHIAVAVSLFPEHQDYHGGTENYYAAKKNIIKYQTSKDYYLYNSRFPMLQKWASEVKSQAVPFLKNLPFPVSDIPLLGEHNLENVCGAVTAVNLLKVESSALHRAIKTFKPLPHRLEYIGQFAGIHFYDDAISTAPQSTIAALKALKKVDTLLLGGEDRGYDFNSLAVVIKEAGVKNIVLFPDSGKMIGQSLKNNHIEVAQILETDQMSQAVSFAFQQTLTDGICLLSAASPSYSLWKDFQEKGNQFQHFVKAYQR
ncbi:UDP-N-acetylmuramoylalanine--D-glutamate ligase [Candidatus Roizmanbacteria bacterium RIFCSPHIGHO2_12_FULL_41_11]|uniref:UDP-N-acetylmuramoylalanine--D-glutamate ligase n=1 Tax=Candidatus Roizmanbacteria bacterium RIFCSPHIGHO2_12_FULL_41_11 TaxID=1802052 RepID=A0A1F7I2K8_9BACT|nr:MAG: UDP-N-acetylmuramoylalanine--D-glutamate ligase [Candidatus Roizmanbacteria bacterium RIFCSPHIGHO2_12_FULL_41_11]